MISDGQIFKREMSWKVPVESASPIMGEKANATVYLSCASCGAVLTRLVEWSKFSTFDRNVADRHPPVERGTIVRWDVDDTVPVYFGDGRPEGQKVYSRCGAISIHPDDVMRDQIQSCESTMAVADLMAWMVKTALAIAAPSLERNGVIAGPKRRFDCAAML